MQSLTLHTPLETSTEQFYFIGMTDLEATFRSYVVLIIVMMINCLKPYEDLNFQDK